MSDRPVIAQAEQFTYELPFETEAEALAVEAQDRAVSALLGDLRARGYCAFEPPPWSPSDGFSLCGHRDGCRVIVAYLPPWSLSQHRDKWVCRVDTLATLRAPQQGANAAEQASGEESPTRGLSSATLHTCLDKVPNICLACFDDPQGTYEPPTNGPAIVDVGFESWFKLRFADKSPDVRTMAERVKPWLLEAFAWGYNEP